MPKGKKGKKAAPERAYGRLTRNERNEIERLLDRGESCRRIADELGRSPSTVRREVDRHRFVTSPSSRRGEPAPDGLGEACPGPGSWPRCRDGCKRGRAYGCSRRPRVFYSARLAQRAADAELSSARSGTDETEESAAAKLAAIRDGLGRGLSPEQIAASDPGLGLSASTIYRWVEAGYDRLSNMDLRRKVGYRRRRRRAEGKGARHSERRLHDAFLALGGDACASAWETGTVEGCAADSARLLTLLHRPTRLQLALPVADGTCGPCWAASGSCAPRWAPGASGARSRSCSRTTARSSPTRAPSRSSSARPPGRRGSSTATRGAPTRRGPARRATWRSARSCPRAGACASTC